MTSSVDTVFLAVCAFLGALKWQCGLSGPARREGGLGRGLGVLGAPGGQGRGGPEALNSECSALTADRERWPGRGGRALWTGPVHRDRRGAPVGQGTKVLSACPTALLSEAGGPARGLSHLWAHDRRSQRDGVGATSFLLVLWGRLLRQPPTGLEHPNTGHGEGSACPRW